MLPKCGWGLAKEGALLHARAPMKVRNSSDWVIALAVVVCSIVLFSVLAVALSGAFIGNPANIIRADFEDITGIATHSRVKFAGAPAGVVAEIRVLTPEERLASGNQANKVRLGLAVSPSLPRLREGAFACLSADTILADKFVQIFDGDPGAPALAPDAVLPSITPVAFDQLVRNADGVMEDLNALMGSGGSGALFAEVRALLGDAREILAGVPPVIAGMDAVAVEARGLLAETRQPLARTIGRLEAAAAAMDSLATRADSMLVTKGKAADQLIADLRVTSQNAKVATTFLKILALRLARNPSHLVWGRTAPPPLPTEKEILTSPKPVPVGTP
jgi:ABC-type transporter Mla subunit MlaD